MRNSWSILILALACPMALGCGKGSQSASGPPVQIAQAKANAARPAGDAVEMAASPLARKVIFNSEIEIIVEHIATAQTRLTSLIDSIREQGGYLARQESTGSSYSNGRGTWIIKVPVSQFDEFIAELETVGHVQRNSRRGDDVTEVFTDLEARLRNKQSSEQRLIAHLEKSATLRDTLELEHELSRVRGEIEQLQGQLNLLKNKTDLATVTVNLFERRIEARPPQPTFAELLVGTFRGSCRMLVSVVQALTLVAAALAPWTVLLTLVLPFWLVSRVFGRGSRLSSIKSEP